MRMLLLYILFAVYIAAVNVYSVILLISLKNDALPDQRQTAGDGKLLIAAILGGAIGTYVAMFVLRYKLKDVLLMILLPVIAVFNVWLAIAAFRFGVTLIVV